MPSKTASPCDRSILAAAREEAISPARCTAGAPERTGGRRMLGDGGCSATAPRRSGRRATGASPCSGWRRQERAGSRDSIRKRIDARCAVCESTDVRNHRLAGRWAAISRSSMSYNLTVHR